MCALWCAVQRPGVLAWRCTKRRGFVLDGAQYFTHGGQYVPDPEKTFGPIPVAGGNECLRSEEHTSELQSLMRISYAVFCLKKKKSKIRILNNTQLRYDN